MATGTLAVWLENLLINLNSKWNVGEISDSWLVPILLYVIFFKAQNSRNQDSRDSSMSHNFIICNDADVKCVTGLTSMSFLKHLREINSQMRKKKCFGR